LHDITLGVTLRQLLSDYAETQNFAPFPCPLARKRFCSTTQKLAFMQYSFAVIET